MSTVSGTCDPAFGEVREEFDRNFAERGEVGASVAIWWQGQPVVDLWGGLRDQATAAPWQQDTMAVVFSATKGLAAVCMHMLADRGLIDFAAPIARYWPEFAANGKSHITVAMLMAHQAGLPVFQQPLPSGAFTDWTLVTNRLAAEPPVWEPGTQSGYHAVTLGFMQGEIVRRVTGCTIGEFLRSQVCEPLGAEAWIGLPDEHHHRVATASLDDPNPASGLYRKVTDEPASLAAKIVTNTGDDISPASINSPARRRAEIPAAGGIANARGLARIYAALANGGAIDGIRLVSAERLPLMRTVRAAAARDQILQVATTFTLGFSKSWGDRALGEGEFAILGEHAFGTVGMGGSVGFADGDAQLAFGYVMNRHGAGIGLNSRGQSLIDAAYRAVGYRSSAPGFWIR